MFDGVAAMDQASKVAIYGQVYLLALLIPAISVSGVLLATLQLRQRRRVLRMQGRSEEEVERLLDVRDEKTQPNFWYFGGGLAFVFMTLVIGLTSPPFSQEIVFAGSMMIVLFLMTRLIRCCHRLL